MDVTAILKFICLFPIILACVGGLLLMIAMVAGIFIND